MPRDEEKLDPAVIGRRLRGSVDAAANVEEEKGDVDATEAEAEAEAVAGRDEGLAGLAGAGAHGGEESINRSAPSAAPSGSSFYKQGPK